VLTILKPTDRGIRTSSQIREGCWINLVSPSEEELQRIRDELGVMDEFLRYPLDQEETSRVESEDDQLLIIVKIPDPQHKENIIRFETIPLGIILTRGCIITLCSHETPVLTDITATRGALRLMHDQIHFIFTIFLRVANAYLRQLRLIDRLTDEYEEELQRSLRNQELVKLFNLEKSLVYFNTSLKANDIVMARLKSGRYLPISDDNEDILEDAQIENQQAIEMAKIYSDILSGMMDAYASVISNNLNIVMKFLTSVTIILMLPNLVASIYGMNVALPLQNSPHAFAVTMGIAFLLSLLVVFIFYKKRLF